VIVLGKILIVPPASESGEARVNSKTKLSALSAAASGNEEYEKNVIPVALVSKELFATVKSNGENTLVLPPVVETFQAENVLVSESKVKTPTAVPPSANVAFNVHVIGKQNAATAVNIKKNPARNVAFMSGGSFFAYFTSSILPYVFGMALSPVESIKHQIQLGPDHVG
jgi:hypothetical protein